MKLFSVILVSLVFCFFVFVSNAPAPILVTGETGTSLDLIGVSEMYAHLSLGAAAKKSNDPQLKEVFVKNPNQATKAIAKGFSFALKTVEEIDPDLSLWRLLFVAEGNDIPLIKVDDKIELYDKKGKKLGSIPFKSEPQNDLFEVTYFRRADAVGWQPGEPFFLTSATWPKTGRSPNVDYNMYFDEALRRWASAIFISSTPFIIASESEFIFQTNDEYHKKTGVAQIVYKVYKGAGASLNQSFVPPWEKK